MKRKNWLFAALAVLVLFLAFTLYPKSKSESAEITTKVLKGPFEVLVYSSGQLEAQNSEDISIPTNLMDRNIRIYEINITDLIEEGTVVDSGDYVATLDRKKVEELLATAEQELETAYNEFEDAKMDSNLTLSNYRDEIINATEEVEAQQIVLDESKYESPSVIRKAEMDLDKAKRKLKQQKNGYVLKERQAVAKVDRSKIELDQKQTRVNKLQEVFNSLKIIAPKSGMIIYGKDRMREKIKVGSTISPWMPVIATLPDMSSMQSLSFVNEIDISKIKKGQKVTLGIDAIPGKVMEGEVVTVANIGQPMPKGDAKVFEVKVRIFGDVSGLKPAMTTSNIIETALYQDTLCIPTEAVFENDSLQYVYLKNNKTIKQIVDLGDQNENFILVRKGLKEGDVVLLTEPEGNDNLALEGQAIWKEIKERKAREEAEELKRIEEDKKAPYMPNKKGKGGGGGMIIIG